VTGRAQDRSDTRRDARQLILGIGNLLMGDEGVGIHVLNHLERAELPASVKCLDGGTGGFALLEPMQAAERVVLIDATVDGQPLGTLQRLRPQFSRDYPPTLTAHDIGLKDLIDAFYLLGQHPHVNLFAISVALPGELSTELSEELAIRVPQFADQVLEDVRAWDRGEQRCPAA